MCCELSYFFINATVGCGSTNSCIANEFETPGRVDSCIAVKNCSQVVAYRSECERECLRTAPGKVHSPFTPPHLNSRQPKVINLILVQESAACKCDTTISAT